MKRKNNEGDVSYESDLNDSSYEATLKRLKEALLSCQKEKEEYLSGWQRAKADFINSRRIHEEEKKTIVSFAKESFLYEMLPALDHFQMALKDKSWNELSPAWRVGIENIYKELWRTLSSLGLASFNDLGKPFDPSRHDSVGILSTNNERDDGIIIEILQLGYEIGGKIIRPARVKIGNYKK